MGHLQDASTARGQQTRQWARDLIARMTTDPIAMAVAERGVIWELPEREAYGNDVCGSPSETVNLEHYGRVAAERERLRRMAE